MPSDFPAAFAALRAILKKHSNGMVVKSDTPADCTIVTPSIGPNGKPIYFGAVLLKKSAVTFHLFPLYFNPKLQTAIHPSLLPRKQGKTCFNFQRPDETLFARLDDLTGIARRHWEKLGFLQPGTISNSQMESSLRDSGVDTVALARQRKQTAQQAARKRAATIRKRAAAPSRPKPTR